MSQQLSIALRSIITGRYYSLVSVAGLAIAITVVLLVALLVRHETSFGHGFAKADSIYRVRNIIKAPRQASDLVLFTAGAFFLILVASFNFMNLQIARSVGRGQGPQHAGPAAVCGIGHPDRGEPGDLYPDPVFTERSAWI